MNGEKFTHVGLDVIGPLCETTEGYQYLIVFTDTYSKWVVAFPAKDKLVTTVVNILKDKIIMNYGWMYSLTLNQNDVFISYMTNFFANTFDIVYSKHEVFNSIFCTMVSNLGIHWFRNWELLLLNYKNTVHPETRNKPIFLYLGRIDIRPIRKRISLNEDIDGENKLFKKYEQEVDINFDPNESKTNFARDMTKTKNLKSVSEPNNNRKKSKVITIENNDTCSEEKYDIYGSLRGNRWLDDIVVNEYADLITKTSRFKYLDSLNFEIIKKEKDPELLAKHIDKLKENLNIDFKDTNHQILGIVHVDGNHWISFHMIPGVNIKFYDPLANKNINNESWLAKRLKCFSEFLEKVDPDTTYDILQDAFLDQDDGYNCGVYVCGYIDYKVNKRARKFYKPEIHRNTIYLKLTGTKM